MAGLEDDCAGMQFAQGGEELVGQAFVEGEFGRELDENRAELLAESVDGLEELEESAAGVYEFGGVGDGFGGFDGEAEIFRGGGCPAFPGGAAMGAVEAGVDFDAAEAGGVALEM